VNGGAFQQVGNLTALPAYSDADVKRGNQYRYQINAVDQRNNTSERSAPVTVTY
jgi:fibronectin type 3 domain-containing protein